ncbi:MAG: hypothetical protein GY827_03715 [Cytophagales bacterium]|nr:hypothetical protein [Cytophagales bacterium]
MNKYLLLFITVISSLSSWAISQTYKYNVFNSENGIAQNYIYSVVQDPRGYLWVGTGEGVSRYDGKDIKTYTKEDGLAENFITSIAVLDKGKVILGHFEGGISLYDGDYFSIVDTITIESKVIDFASYQGKHVYGLTSNTGIFLYKEDSIIIQKTPELQGRIAYNIIELNHEIFVATNEGLIHYKIENDHSLKFIKEFSKFEYVSISALTLKPNNKGFWIGTEEEGIFEYIIDEEGKGKVVEHPTPKLIRKFEVHEILEDKLGNLWIGTKLHGIYRLEYSKENTIKYVDIFTEDSDYPSNLVNTLFEDTEGNVWAGTYGDGLIQMIAKEFVFFNLNKKFKIGAVKSIVQTYDSTFYYGTDRGLYHGRINYHDTMYVFQKMKALEGQGIECLHTKKGDSILWIGTKNKGLHYYNLKADTTADTTHYLEVTDISSFDKVRVITEGENNTLWLSVATKGVYHIKKSGELIKHYDTRSGFLHNDIFDIFKDSKGRIWFTTHSAGLAFFHDGKMELLSQKGSFPIRDVNTVTEDKNGIIWIATEGSGVYSFDEKEFKGYTSESGLISNYCYSIITDDDNNVWIGHRSGISKIYIEQDSIVVFSEKNGLETTECLSQSICKDHRGHIWFGNSKGITKHDYNVEHHQGHAFPTYIADILLFSKKEDLSIYPLVEESNSAGVLGQYAEFPYKKNHFTFDFISVSLKKQNGIYYQYILDGYDKDWQKETKNNVANYTNLDPGVYTFKVKSSNNGKHWSEEVSYNFVIIKPFWERWWFFAAQILFLISVIFAVNRYSKSSNNKRLMRYLTFASVFIVFKFVNIIIEPLFRDLTGGIPIVKVFFNLVVAFCLLPAEKFIRKFAVANRNI